MSSPREEYLRIHSVSDVDAEPNSQHHTLGDGPTQAASGAETLKRLNLMKRTKSSDTGDGDITAATGWTIDQYELRRFGNHVSFYVVATRSGATVASATDGNITNTDVFSVSNAYAPYHIAPVGSGAIGRMFSARINTTRTVVITAVGPGQGIPSGEQYSFVSTYLSVVGSDG